MRVNLGICGEGVEMEQLSWTDDMMLRAEKPETPMQIQMLLIYDQSTAPDGRVTFKRILSEIDARLHLAPTFRRRLTELPGGMHMPYWVDDPNFDLEYHVRHIALPQPGDWRQLCIQIARIHGRQLDLRRPPWEMTVIEGLNSIPGVPTGSFAISLKLHHCVVDGMESVELMAAMHDLAFDSPRPAPPEKPWNPGPLPSTADLVSRTAINGVLHPLRAGKILIPSALGALRNVAELPGKIAGGVAAALGPGSGSLFAPTHAFQRRADTAKGVRSPLSRPGRFQADQGLRAGRDHQRCGTCLRRRCASPLSGGPRQSCPTRLSSPPARLRFGPAAKPVVAAIDCSADCTRSKPRSPTRSNGWRRSSTTPPRSATPSDSSSSTRLMELVGTVPTTLLGLTVKAASAVPFSAPAVANTTVSNVPGPADPIFFAGARLLRVTGLGPLIGGMNLFHIVASYNGTISIGVTADRSALPDPGHYADCMQDSFDEMLSAAG